MLELAFRPDPATAEPLYRQLASYLQALIESGRLRAGQKLPATRALAGALGLSRNTVNLAYQGLIDGDWLRAHVGQGTFVAERPELPRAAPGPGRDALAPEVVWEALLAKRARAAAVPAALRGPAPTSVRFDLRSGRVDPEAIAVGDLRRAFARALERDVSALADPPSARGWPPLREAIARSLVARGVVCGAEDVMVTNGVQQGLDLLAQVLVDPGDIVAVEDPGYFGAALAFRAAGASLVPIGVDDEGIRVDALARVAARRPVKLVYTTPAVQYPTGVSMSDARREALLALADRHTMAVLEDDYDGELRLDDPIVPALKARDTRGHVVYLGTFSKALFPGLRLGYVVAPPALQRALARAKLRTDFGTSTLDQAALTEWLESGAHERHVRRVRRHIATQLDAALDALAREMPEGTRFNAPAGGNQIWVTLPPGVDPALARHLALEAGVFAPGGEAFHLDGDGAEHLSICVARLAPGEVREAVARLADATRSAAAGGATGADREGSIQRRSWGGG